MGMYYIMDKNGMFRGKKKDGTIISEFRFKKYPIYYGIPMNIFAFLFPIYNEFTMNIADLIRVFGLLLPLASFPLGMFAYNGWAMRHSKQYRNKSILGILGLFLYGVSPAWAMGLFLQVFGTTVMLIGYFATPITHVIAFLMIGYSVQ